MTVNTAALDAIADAAHEFAAKVLAAKAAFGQTFSVGQEITFIQARDEIPVGTVFADRDGDKYRREADGIVWNSDSNSADNIPARYQPLTIVSLPEETPAEEPLADWERELLAATPAPAPAVKVGDTVRIKSVFFPNRTEYVGRVATVTDLNRRRTLSQGTVPIVVDVDGTAIYCTEVEAVGAIKAGDRVRIKALSWGLSDHIGQTGTVEKTKHVEGDAYKLVVQIPGVVGNRLYRTEDVEKVEDVKEGDRVRIDAVYYGYRYPYVGQEGTVERVCEHDDPEAIVGFVNVPGGQTIAATSWTPVTPAPEPVPTELDRVCKYDDRRIMVLPSYPDVRISLQEIGTGSGETVFAFLTQDQAREVAETLVAAADEAASSPAAF